MRPGLLATLVFWGGAPAVARAQSPVDSALAAFISTIRAVDNHTHVNTTVPRDSEFDALPLDGLPPFALPARIDPNNPELLAGYKELYAYQYTDLSDAHRAELRADMERVAREHGERFPEWVLDKIGVDVMLANRIAMGPGVQPPRFRWVSYVDALMLPLSTVAERAATPDYRVLYPLEERLLQRYLADFHMTKVPPTLDAYLRSVVTPTLEAQRRNGCVAVKFEAAYLRALDFDEASEASVRPVYARYAAGGVPPHAQYKALQDFLFRYIAREAGRLGMAVHIHSLEGGGGFYRAAGSDPLLLESAFNDSTLRGTSFVIIHGGGIFAAHAGAMLWKPNVWLDMSAMDQLLSPATLAPVLRGWLEQYPDKVLYGSDAFTLGPDAGWELSAWLAETTARQALGIALTGMMRDGEITRARAEEIATMVLRTNAARLYKLPLR
ncbi:MAG TPA: amidohydrolase family protein [Gemmatimonadales bacterium]|nr:amidohydrolase family protein [Gemmatimonadales bacterium]